MLRFRNIQTDFEMSKKEKRKAKNEKTKTNNGKRKTKNKPTLPSSRVLINSKFGPFYSNFLILISTFSKVPIEKYGNTPFFSGKHHFCSYFQNPGENSVAL